MHRAAQNQQAYQRFSLTSSCRRKVITSILMTLLLFVFLRVYVSAAVTMVLVQPSSQTVWGIGESVTLNITVGDVNDLYGWEIKLYYDGEILNGTSVVEGPFLKTRGETYFHYTIDDNYNATYGRLAAFNSLLGNISGESGSGVLLSITFRTIGLGSCILGLRDTKLGDSTSTLMTHDTIDGSIQVVRTVHDVAINSVSVSSNEVVEGQTVNVYVNVANQGNKTETFNVVTYSNETIIDTQTVTNLPSKSETTLAFTWNTPSVTSNTSFIIRAEASPVPDEINLANNILTDGLVKIIKGVHNVAILSVTSLVNEVYEGSVVNIKVEAANNGNYSEIFQVTAYYNDTVISTQTVSLLYNSAQYVNFAWDTTGVEVNATYVIKAFASYLPEETNLTDNTLIDGNIKVYPRTMLSINIAEVTPSNQVGEPLSHFTAGTTAYFQVLVSSNALTAETILVTVNVHDSQTNTIGVASFNGPLASGTTTFLIGFPIPHNVALGDAVVYVNALTDWPHLGGTPLCPEKLSTFEITGP